jgi:glucose-6-phosphate isomerase
MRCDQTAAWQALQTHATHFAGFDLRTAFAQDASRAQDLSQSAPHVFADLSKNHVDVATEALLQALARQTGLAAHRDAMFRGEHINTTEDRAVMHWLLRQPEGSLSGALAAPLKQVHGTLKPMLAYAEQVRADAQITDVVNIGIGGSDLGPQMAVLALQDFVLPGKRFHFVSNVDGHELAAVLKDLKPQSTLFLIASKTFTTLETMTNAHSALAWFKAQGGADVARHFAALTTNVAAAAGLPVAMAIGAKGFRDLLAGAHAMDQHFQTAELADNLPVRLGLLDVWYRNFLHYTSRSVAPYHSALRRLPAYLQQLEMESNGKRVDRNGQALPYGTSPVVWGEPGTNGQHAYFQMLHQGTNTVPLEFIAVKKPSHQLAVHHELLLANVIAQAQALMLGQADEGGHKHFPGNRPSSFLLLDELKPSSLGALIALQEHRVFVSGAVWGINSFDQWGVELGKRLAQDVRARMASGDVAGLDASTAALLGRVR